MGAAAQPPPFLDVATLLESSLPRARVAWFRYALGIFLLIVLGGTLISRQSEQAKALVDVLGALSMLVLMGLLVFATMFVVRRHRAEQQQVEAAAELVQLRRWPQAAVALQQYLATPARTPQLRSQALIYLASVLARYHRFDDAIAVQNHLIENRLVDEGTAYGLRLGRAMAMLREDHLFDADRAISELRQIGRAGERATERAALERAEAAAAATAGAAGEAVLGEAVQSAPAKPAESGGLALIEIYRDVKTGHPAEAVTTFEDKLPAMRDQLGHRVADAYALAARAYDLLGRETEARDAYEKATLLSPPIELHRRYPEVAAIAGKYGPAVAPPEMA